MSARRRNPNRGKSGARDGPGRSDAPPFAAAGPGPSRRRSWVVTLGIVLAVGLVAVALSKQWGWFGHARPVLSSLKLEGLDPVLAEAIEEAEAGVREAPKSGAAWGRLGQVLFVHGMGGPAAECFARASELAKDDPRWLYLRGRSIARENGDAALPYLRQAAQMCRGEPPAPSLVLAELLLERGELAEAAAQIEIVLGREPNNPRALLDRGRLHIARAEWDAAKRDLEDSIRVAPQVKASHLLLAKVYGRAGDPAAATREAQRARGLSDDPRWPDPFLEEMSSLAVGRAALLERAEMLLGRGEPKPAIVVLETLASRYPNDVAVLVTLGEAYRHDGRSPQAEETFRRAVAATPAGGPDATAARTGLGTTLCEERRFNEALPPLREAVQLNPNLPETHYNLAACLLGLGDRGGAIEALRDAVRVEPSFRKGYVALGRALAEAGKPAEAAEALKRAMELDGDDPATAELLRSLGSK